MTAVDASGNEAEVEIKFQIVAGGGAGDATPPEISVTGVSDGDVVTSPDTVTISFTVTDDEDPSPTVTATLNGDLIELGEEVEVTW